MKIVGALVDRYGSINLDISVLSLLPQPTANMEEKEVLKNQNRSLSRAIRGMVHKRRYPVQLVTAHKWFLKRVKNPDESIDIEEDGIFFEEGSDAINQNGQIHLHLLLARVLQLRKISYEWSGMPVVNRKIQSKFSLLGKGKGSVVEVPHQMRKGHGNRLKSGRVVLVEEKEDVEPPKLVEMA